MSEITPEEIGHAIGRATEDGWVAAKPHPAATSCEWWPGVLAVLCAADDLSAVAWVADPDGYDLQVARPSGETIRFRARNPATSPPDTRETPE